MEKQPRCKKCGRRLKSPMSIARGMGPKCAGITSTSGKSVRTRSKPSSRTAYSDKSLVQVQAPLFRGELPKKRLSRRSMQSQKCLCFSGVVYIQAREPRSSGVCGRPLVGVGGRFAFNS